MRHLPIHRLAAAALLGAGGLALLSSPLGAQGGPPPGPQAAEAVTIALKESFDVPLADAQTEAIVAAAQAFLATLTDEQRTAVVFPLGDNAQRANWSNLPPPIVERAGVRRGDMSETQLAALDALLATAMSEEGFLNVLYQLEAEDQLTDGGPGGLLFGAEHYAVSFLGEPSTTQPWMLQFGGHHLAINVTMWGPDVSFSPMLTGGQPLSITFGGQPIYITADETAAARRLMDALTDEQRGLAVRGDEPINLLLGPGEFGTALAPEGIAGRDLTEAQQALLLAVIEARLSFINADDFAAKMKTVRAELADTHFAWWGPAEPLGAAYFRVTGPSVVMEYAPQDMGGDPAEHAHNMYRDPTNDYGVAWIGVE